MINLIIAILAFLVQLLFTVGGGLYRRVFGGWTGQKRSLVVVASPLFALPAFLIGPWWAGLVIIAVSFAHWTFGHQWDRPWLMAARYIPIPLFGGIFLAWASWTLFPLVFCLAGFFTVAMYFFANNGSIPVDWVPSGMDSFIDGPIAIAEISSGAFYYGLLSLAALPSFIETLGKIFG